jgi:hypothetical protein
MTRWTVLTVAAVTNVIAALALGAALWWGSGSGTAPTLARAGTIVISTASLVILYVVFRRTRLTARESVGAPTTKEASRGRRAISTWNFGIVGIDSAPVALGQP